MRPTNLVSSIFAVLCLVAGLATLTIGQDRKSANRAKLPTFDTAKTNRIFFPDVFARLEGERPANPNARAVQSPAGGGPGGGDTAASQSYAWSKIISGVSIEDEIKAIKLATDKNITTPQDFAGRGYKEIRRDFSVLAMLFAIINEHDGDVRWKNNAAAARDMFARTASNAKAGNNNVYNESKKRKDELQDILNGATLAEKAETEDNNWEQIADRSPLMQRLEAAQEKKLAKWTSSADAFSEEIEGVMREAEIIAAISEVLTREGMEDGDDETYAGFANLMKQSALDVVAAVKSNNAEQARKATGEIAKACSDCHDNYR
ncbi:MAG: cytochrome c [Planctomycetaceae bacterium]|nr:cytochrome c [Planctomycetales bacterium]MCB9927103.1 cytochrome c [Planctomycetaceae bacterium]